MDDAVKVSVVMPTFNGEKFLHQSIESILNQTYKHFEFIIVDDGSNDKSAEIIHSFADPRIKYIYQNQKGPASAYNRGIKNASSEYIFLMDHDDVSLTNRIERQLKYTEKNALDICGSFFIIKNKSKKYQEKKILPISHNEIKEELSTYPWALFNPTICSRKNVFESFGYFDENYCTAFDYEFYLRNIEHVKCGNVPEFLYIWNFSPQSYGYKSSINGLETFKKLAEDNLEKKKNLYSREDYYSKEGLINYYSGNFFAAGKYFLKSTLNGNWEKKTIGYLLLSSFMSPIVKMMRKKGYFSHPWIIRAKGIFKQ